MKTCRLRPSRRIRIDLWVASTGASSAPLPIDYFNFLSNQEKERFARLRQESDRRRYLVSRVLLRMALSNASSEQVDPRCWQFSTTKNGKPAIAVSARLPLLNFSLSHSNRLAVVAVSLSSSVGVDVEFLNPTSHAAPADLALARGERRWLQSRPTATRWLDFVRLWTVKEAYVKLLGQGVYLDFASFEIAMDPLRMVRTETGQRHPADLHLETREFHVLDGSYQLSLAARSPTPRTPEVALRVFDGALMEDKQFRARRAG